MIDVNDLTFSYNDKQAPVFQGFDWHAETGEAWAVIGPSGCGKSTLLVLLAGLRQPDGGSITIAGERVTRPRPETGLILQDHGLLPWATVLDNARLGLNIREMYGPDGRHAPRDAVLDRAAAHARVNEWLTRLGIDELANKYPSQISGGQRQRAAIARTLALSPDLLLMDEPFSALDAPTREDLQELTVELQRETGLTTIIVTHNIEEAVYLGRKILVLHAPPNTEAHVVENPGAGQPGYRSEAAYLQQVDAVRGQLGGRS